APQDQHAAVRDIWHRPAGAGANAANAIRVARVAKARPQPQRSRVILAFGVPKAFASRWMKPVESPIAVVEGDDTVKATACGPYCFALRRIAAAVRFSASSRLPRSQRGLGCPFGRVRRRGCVSLSG